MTIKNDTNIEEEMTCRLKIGMRNFTNFDPSTCGSLRPNYKMFELQKYITVL